MDRSDCKRARSGWEKVRHVRMREGLKKDEGRRRGGEKGQRGRIGNGERDEPSDERPGDVTVLTGEEGGREMRRGL